MGQAARPQRPPPGPPHRPTLTLCPCHSLPSPPLPQPQPLAAPLRLGGFVGGSLLHSGSWLMRCLYAGPPSQHGAIYVLCSHCVDIVHPLDTHPPDSEKSSPQEAAPDVLSGAELMAPGRCLCPGAFALTAPVIYLGLCCKLSASELRGSPLPPSGLGTQPGAARSQVGDRGRAE